MQGEVTLASTLKVSGSATITGAVVMSSTMSVIGGATLSSSLLVSGAATIALDATLSSKLTVEGEVTLKNTVKVTSVATAVSIADVYADNASYGGTVLKLGSLATGSGSFSFIDAKAAGSTVFSVNGQGQMTVYSLTATGGMDFEFFRGFRRLSVYAYPFIPLFS